MNINILKAAVVGLEAEKAAVERNLAEVHRLLREALVASALEPTTTTAPVKTTPSITKAKRNMSAAGRARIAAAQKKRWDAFHKKQKKAAG